MTQTIDAAGKSTDELQAKAYAQMSPADAQKAFLEASATAAGLVPQFQAITQDGLLPMVEATDEIATNLLEVVSAIAPEGAAEFLGEGPISKEKILELIENTVIGGAGLAVQGATAAKEAVESVVPGADRAFDAAGRAVNVVLNVDGMEFASFSSKMVENAMMSDATGS